MKCGRKPFLREKAISLGLAIPEGCSRQYVKQMILRAEGLWIICGKGPLASKSCCLKHHEKRMQYQRDLLGYKKYSGHRGRPPFISVRGGR